MIAVAGLGADKLDDGEKSITQRNATRGSVESSYLTRRAGAATLAPSCPLPG